MTGRILHSLKIHPSVKNRAEWDNDHYIFLRRFFSDGRFRFGSLELCAAQAEDHPADLFEHREGQQYAEHLALAEGFRQPEAFRDAEHKASGIQDVGDKIGETDQVAQ